MNWLLVGLVLFCSSVVVLCEESRIVNGFNLNDYHSFGEIVKYVNSVQNNRLSVEILGFSSEQRPIPIVKVIVCWRAIKYCVFCRSIGTQIAQF